MIINIFIGDWKGKVIVMKKFRMIWIGELFSCIGSGMTAFALSVYVFQMTGSAAYVSLVTLLAYLPSILLSPIGGVLADRYDRRLLMILGDLCSGLGILYLLISIQLGNGGMAPVLICVTIDSLFVALMEPSYKATVTDLLSEEEYAKASGLVQLAGNAKFLISPALAGVLLGFADIRLILILDIATFFVTIFAVMCVRRTLAKPVVRDDALHIVKELSEGMRFLRGRKVILSLVYTMTLLCFFMGVVQTLMPVMALSITDAKSVGILESVSAVGMVMGSLAIGIFGIKRNHAKILAIAAAFCGLFMALSGVNETIWFIGAMLFLFFAMLPFMNTCADVLIRVSIPNELQGRVWSLIGLLSQMGTVAAFAVCGVLADYVFEPLLADDGMLADSVGAFIGTGAGRGIGFFLILCGIAMMIVSGFLFANKNVRNLKVGESMTEG